jgi:hypothetical protein
MGGSESAGLDLSGLGQVATGRTEAKATADPSTALGAENAPNFAQDDSIYATAF